MDREKFEQMMAAWAEKERQAMPDLRPTREMYRAVKARRQPAWFPFVNRWATVGVAALALIVSILVLRPQFFQSSHKEPEQLEKPEVFSEGFSEEDSFGEAESSPPVPAESEAPEPQRERRALQEEDMLPVAEEESAVDLGASASEAKDRAFSLAKKEDSRMEEDAPQDKLQGAPVLMDDATKSASAPVLRQTEALQPSRHSARSRILQQEDNIETDEMLEMKSAAPRAVLAPEKRKGAAAPEGQMLAGDMEQEEEAGVRILKVPGRQDSDEIVSKVFTMRDGIWIDREHDAEKVLIPIKRNSPAFRELLTAKPELQVYIDRYGHIIINLGTHSVEISDSGKSELSAEELKSLFQ